MDPATLAQIAATHPLVRTVESGEEPTGPAAEAIRRQVESLLAIDMEDPELHEAMEVVADLWKSKGMGNTAENRRNLRSDLERQAVERCEDFVRQMAPMRDMLRRPPRGFESAVRHHFVLTRPLLQRQLAAWLGECKLASNKVAMEKAYTEIMELIQQAAQSLPASSAPHSEPDA